MIWATQERLLYGNRAMPSYDSIPSTRLDTLGLHDLLNRVLREYEDAKKQPMKGHPFMEFRRQIERDLLASDALRKRPDVDVSASFGQGNWATIPWLAFLDRRETKTTQEGVYPVYLFRQDMKGVYLTFNQGVTKLRNELGMGQEFRDTFAARKRALRPFCKSLEARGFSSDEGINLGTDAGLGKQYEVSTVAYKFYPSSKLPEEGELQGDLEAVLSAYDDYMKTRPELASGGTALPRNRGQREPAFTLSELQLALPARGLAFPPGILTALQVGMTCQPICLLAGPTGTGKTQLGLTLGALKDVRVEVVEVEGGWADSASAFGFISPATQDFVPGPILLALLRLLRADEERPQRPVLLLDEINISPTHIYLAPLLSVLERAYSQLEPVELTVAQSGLSEQSRSAIRAAKELHPALQVIEIGPFLRLTLAIPPSLRVLGTLNFDGTTEDLAPKLLSRSFVVWFEAPKIQRNLQLIPASSYNVDAVKDVRTQLADVLRDLVIRGYPVSSRAVQRAETVLDSWGSNSNTMLDLLLSGLILPHIQTIAEGQDQAKIDEEFLSGLPEGLFRSRLEAMRRQVVAEGMANLWLVA